MATELVLNGVKFPDGSVQSTAAVTATSTPGWNVTYLGPKDVQIGAGGTWNVPANCLGVYVYCYVWGGNNNGGNGRLQLRNSSGSVVATVYVHGTNAGDAWSRGDGGSGMADAGAAFVPLSTNITSIYFDIYDNAVAGKFYIQAYVTR